MRIPVSMLDGILYRIDELVALKLRLDYQRNQIEDLQVRLEHVQSDLQRRGTLAPELEEPRRRLENVRRSLAQEVLLLGMTSQGIQEDVKDVRMLAMAPLFDPLRRMVRDLAQQLDKEVTLEVSGEEVRVDKRLLEMVKDPITHLLRNAVDHGIELPAERTSKGKPARGRVRLAAESRDAFLWVEVEDDGRGIDASHLRATAAERKLVEQERLNGLTDRDVMNLIFLPGFSTASQVTHISGRGVGLDVVRDSVARLGGRIEFFSQPNLGSTFRMCLPLAVIASGGLLVRANRETYCIPLSAIDEVVVLTPKEVGLVSARMAMSWRRQTMTFVPLDELLTGRTPGKLSERMFTVILALSDRRLALGVDAVIGQEEVVVKGLPAGTPPLRFVAGVTNLADGQLVTVLDPGQILESALAQHTSALGSVVPPTRPTVLVVDDSVTSRTMVAELLEQAGYRALTAHDGENALAVLQGQQVALVVSDVEMPNIDGYMLVRRLRASPETATIPVILVTSLGDSNDRARGAAAGANAYIVKKDFDAAAFLAIVSEQLEHHTG